MAKARKFLIGKIFIHAMVISGTFALWGYIKTDIKYILLGVAMSFCGAVWFVY